MAVAIGLKGNVTVRTSSSVDMTVAEMGTWSISGPTRNMVEVSAFGDKTGRQELGTLSGQQITFDGYYDGTDTGMAALISVLSSAVPIRCCTGAGLWPAKLKLWAQNDTDMPGYGWWALSTAGTTSATVYMTGMELGQSKDGMGTISFTAAVVDDDFKWSTST
jgi:hypothetical protein